MRTGRPVSLIMIEIDSFKQFIDHYGWEAGDECLREVAEALANSANRAPDFVGRYSENNFAVILAETDNEAAIFVGEKMLEEIELQDIPHRHSTTANHVTISLGLASMAPSLDSSPSKLIDAANNFLDQAKQAGGNQAKPLT